MAKVKKEKNELDNLAWALTSNLGNNILTVISAMGWNQTQFAERMNISVGSLTSYINRGVKVSGTNETKDVWPPLDLVVKMCCDSEIQKKIDFAADDLIFGSLEPNNGQTRIGGKSTGAHEDIYGNFFLYFFDQTSQTAKGEMNTGRNLRYGVISIYEQVKRFGEIGVYAFALFFKTADEAYEFMTELNAVDDAQSVIGEKTKKKYRANSEYYFGEITFDGNHAFVDLSSSFYKDKGLIILSEPEKKPDAKYIGGLGNMVSVSHGANHVPVSQKIIFSRVELGASEEEIGESLSFSSNEISMYEESDEMIQYFKKLYPSGDAADFSSLLDEQDKRALFNNRLSRLLQQKAEKEFSNICTITKEADHAVYKLIQRSMNAKSKND